MSEEFIERLNPNVFYKGRIKEILEVLRRETSNVGDSTWRKILETRWLHIEYKEKILEALIEKKRDNILESIRELDTELSRREDIVAVITKNDLYIDAIEALIRLDRPSDAESLFNKFSVLTQCLKDWNSLDEVDRKLLEHYYTPLNPIRQYQKDRKTLESKRDFLGGLLRLVRCLTKGYGLEEARREASNCFLKDSRIRWSLALEGFTSEIVDALAGYSWYLRSHIVCNDLWRAEEFRDYLLKLRVDDLEGSGGQRGIDEAWGG